MKGITFLTAQAVVLSPLAVLLPMAASTTELPTSLSTMIWVTIVASAALSVWVVSSDVRAGMRRRPCPQCGSPLRRNEHSEVRHLRAHRHDELAYLTALADEIKPPVKAVPGQWTEDRL